MIKVTRQPAKAKQFATKAKAAAAAKAIGWLASDAERVETMGFQVWVIMDPHGNMLTRPGFATLASAKGVDWETLWPDF